MPSSPRTTPVMSNMPPDRKSTRLNSSHDQISYAVFCLKKKTQVVDVWQDEVFLMGARGFDGGRERDALDAGVAVPQQLVRPVLHPSPHVRVRRSTVRRR